MALTDSQAALKSLYLMYFASLLRFTSLYVETTSEAEEVVSDTFLAIWNNRKTLASIANFNAYIYTIAQRKAIDSFRQKHMDTFDLSDQHIDLFACTQTTPEDDLISKEELERLNRAIDSLPEKCKLVFKLIREDKLRYKEVAQILNITVKTVEAHVATAVKKLRLIIKHEE
ncbi:DNA-directed RNA polymerase sigma-70 factor [Bacteroidales bacterium]|nr:DNA-directed RNA polymerase sigma-70 factor [Bacteroidales bacterium]